MEHLVVIVIVVVVIGLKQWNLLSVSSPKRGEVKYGHLLQISNLCIGNRHTQCAELNSWAGSSDSELEFWAQKVFGSGLKITLTHIVRPEELNTRPSWMDNK